MADETLNITVDDSGSTTTVTNNLVKLATAADTVATSTDKVTAATNTEAGALNTTAAATDKAATAAKGYVDAQGNYIRIVGSNKNLTDAQITAQGALSSAYSTTSIEAGRAAAGYGPLNAGLTTSQTAAAASRAAIAELTAGLAGGATSAQAAGVGLGQVGAAGNAAAVGLNNGRSAFQGAGAAGSAAAAGFTAAGQAAGSAGTAVGAAGAASTTAARAANDNATAHRSLGAAFQSTGQAAQQFGGILAGLGLAVGASTVIKYADSYTQVQNKLRVVVTSQQQLNDVMTQSFKIAQQTATPFATVAELFGRVQQRAASLRLSASDVGTVVSTLATAFQISGASGETASRVIEQFNQSLAKGKPEMEDFKSLISSTPIVEQAFVAGLREIGVTVSGGLGPALTSGTVSMQQLLQAMVKVNPILQTIAQNSLPTVAQGFTRVTNAFELYIGQANGGNAITGTLINSLNALSNNMQTVVPIAIALGGLLAFGAVAGAIGAIGGLATSIGGLIAAAGSAVSVLGLLAGPAGIAAIGAVIAVGIPLWNKYGDSIKTWASNALGIGPAATAAAASQTAMAASASSLSGAVQSAGVKVQALQAQVVATKQALDAATPGTAQYTAAQQANQAATQAAATASKDYETALKALQTQQQANATAAKQFNDAINKVQNLNAYGEKLETTAEFLERARANQQKFNEQLKATYAPLIEGAQALNAAGVAATGFSEAVAKAAAATQQGASGFDTYGTQALNAARNLQALTGDAGLFTEAELKANSSLNQGQSAMDGAASSAGNLASAFTSAGNAASFLAIQTKNANTVIGQIGESSGGFSQSYDENFLPLGRGQSGLGQAEIDRQRYSVILQEEAYKKKLDDMHKAAQQQLGVVDPSTTTGTATNDNSTTTALAANTAALTANTSATTSNTTATDKTLPDLLTQTTNIVPGAGPSGIGVGSTSTQTTYTDGGGSGTIPTVAPSLPSGTSIPITGAGVGQLGDGSVMGTENVNYGDFTGTRQRPSMQPIVNITVKASDYGQYKSSERQIAMDIGDRVANAMGAG